MIKREDILSMEYLKKTSFTGSCEGMRYRLEAASDGEGGKRLLATVWPEPFNFITTPEEEKESAAFPFEEDGVAAAVDWMNERLSSEKKRWEGSAARWDTYRMN